MLKNIFDNIYSIGDLDCFLNNLKNVDITDYLEDNHFDSIQSEFINYLLSGENSNIDKYKKEINNIVQGVVNSKLLNENQIIKINELIGNINQININQTEV